MNQMQPVQMDGDYHTFMDYPVQFSLPGIIVPQHVFNPSLRLPPKEPVRFVCNGKLGIRLSDALNARYAGLQNNTQQRALMPDGAPVFTFTIHWPGYSVWQQSGNSPQMQALSISQIANTTAKLTALFLRKTAESGAKSTEPNWEIANIAIESLFLLELRNVG
ncbi:hypothetical protein PHLGIDRAFT_128297, partial [Phlebiopsis gigantea 11061_1 CR5-6]